MKLNINDVRFVGTVVEISPLFPKSSGPEYCELSVGVNDTDTIVPCVVFRKSAEDCVRMLKQNSPVYIEGKLDSCEGNFEINVTRIQFLKSEIKEAA